MAHSIHYKTPTGKLSLVHDATNDLGSADASLVNTFVQAFNSAGEDVSSIVLGTPSATALVLTTVFQLGTDGEDYKVISHAVGNSTGQVSEMLFEVRVRRYMGIGNR